MKRTWKLTETTRSRIAERYSEGLSVCELAKLYDISDQAVYGIVKRRNIAIRSLSDSHRKYDCDHSFFDDLDNEPSSYWLGFLAADGHWRINKNGSHIITLTLQPGDLDHLKALKKALTSEHSIRWYCHMGQFYPRLTITSTPIVSKLLSYGMASRKNLRDQFPPIPPQQLHHFMRGYFDGDGSISKPTEKNSQFRVTGYDSFISQYQQELMRNCDLLHTKFAMRFETPTVAYCGRHQVRRIYEFLYRDATVYLERKRQRFHEILSI